MRNVPERLSLCGEALVCGRGPASLQPLHDPAADHSVSSLAELAGMSRASLSDHFSRAFDQGPMDFVQKTRLRVVARLLEVSDLPI